jgi:hypothetical protein
MSEIESIPSAQIYKPVTGLKCRVCGKSAEALYDRGDFVLADSIRYPCGCEQPPEPIPAKKKKYRSNPQQPELFEV